MTRVAVLDDYQDVALQMADWNVLPPDTKVQVFRDHLSDSEAVAERLKDFDVVVAMRERTPFPRRLLQRLPKLRLLVTTGMRNASIDIGAAAELGITVCGTQGVGYPTAELTWGLILALLRHIPQEDRSTRDGRWQVSMGVGLREKVLGVIGLGNSRTPSSPRIWATSRWKGTGCFTAMRSRMSRPSCRENQSG
jgi:phosphoglycerate dehydrogenase-like enzyme